MEVEEEELEAVNGQGLLPPKLAQGKVVTNKEPAEDIEVAEVVKDEVPNSEDEKAATNDMPEVAQAGGVTHEAPEDTHDDVVTSEPLEEVYDEAPTKVVEEKVQREEEYAEQPFPPSGVQTSLEMGRNLEAQEVTTEALAAPGGSKEAIAAQIVDPTEEEDKGVAKAEEEEEENEVDVGEKEEAEGEGNEVAKNVTQPRENGKPIPYKGSVEVRTGLTAGGYHTLENIDPANGPLHLDSPRSKEALRVLGIKPAELIKRDIESFVGKTPELSAIQAKAYEHTRTGLLREAQKMRAHLAIEQGRPASAPVAYQTMMEDQLDKAKKGERRRKQQAETYQQLVFQQDLQHLWAVERKDGEIRLAMARKNSLLGRDRLQRDNEDKTTKQAKIRSSTKAREDRMWEQHLEKKDSLAQTHEEQMKAAQLRRDQKKEHEQERLLHAAENRKKLGVAQEQRATVRAAEEEERLMKLKEAFKKAKRQREEKQLVDDLGRKDMERRRLLLERQRQHHIAGKNKKYSSQTVKRVEKRDEVAEETVTPRMEHVAFEAESEKAETAYEDDYSHVDETSREEKVKANLTSTGAIMSAAGAQVEMGLADNQVPLRDGVRVIERKNQVVLQRSKTMSVRPRKPLRDLDTRPAWPPANVSCLLAVAADMTIPKPAALKVKAYPSGGMGPAGAVRRGAVGRQGMRRPRREEQEMLVRRLEDQQNRAWVHRLEEEQGREENRHEILRKTQDAGERAILEGIFASERRDSEDSLRKEQAYNEMHIAVAMEDAGLLADQQPRSTKLAPFR